MTEIFDIRIPFSPAIVIPALFLLVVILGYLLTIFVKKILRKVVTKTKTEFDDLIVSFLEKFIPIWVAMGGIFVIVQAFALPIRQTGLINKVLSIGFIITLLIAMAGITLIIIKIWATKSEGFRPIQGSMRFIAKLLFAIIGVLIILDMLDIKITALLASLGIGGIAVALALQDTLANFFSGLYILADRPIRVGDYIKLESGEEGYVVDIGWRSTRIRTLPNNIVVVPNQKLSQTIITNYYLPETRMSLLIPISVSYKSDPRKVEEILVDVAKSAAGEVKGLLSEPAPFVRFIPGFGESSLDFTLICQVVEFTDQYLVQHELRHRIFERFKKEGIEIPFKQIDVHIDKAI
jgi:small-conductance mechanosensitive channel